MVVPYSKKYWVSKPSGFTVPLSVAVVVPGWAVPVVAVAAWAVAGAKRMRATVVASSMRMTRPPTRARPESCARR